MSPHDDPAPRRQLIGSWIDWIDSAARGGPLHHLPREKLLPTVRTLRAVTGPCGPDSPITHRAQAAFLAAVRPEDLFELLMLVADEGEQA